VKIEEKTYHRGTESGIWIGSSHDIAVIARHRKRQSQIYYVGTERAAGLIAFTSAAEAENVQAFYAGLKPCSTP
jgi:hypothetical protein